MLVGRDTYSDAVQDYAARHRIKPGITGLAQINGMRGGIHEIVKARRGVDLDMAYVENWSLALDIRIMLRTIFAGMFGPKVF
jgi:putative colanic acid biosynthesis UDP-glucose lipid carrier transferase